jgi:hypothetical protein
MIAASIKSDEHKNHPDPQWLWCHAYLVSRDNII